MKLGMRVLVISVLFAAAAAAQPTPRLADGKVDFGGKGVWAPIWVLDWANPKYVDKAVEIPFTPAALAKFQERRANNSKDDPEGYCLPPGVPRYTGTPYPFQLIQLPDRVVILYEGASHMYRTVFMDGRKHTAEEKLNPTWLGESIGWWEGNDTLVVDSVGFNGRTWLDYVGHPATEKLHVIEKFRRPDFNTLSYEATIDDPALTPSPGPPVSRFRSRQDGTCWNTFAWRTIRTWFIWAQTNRNNPRDNLRKNMSVETVQAGVSAAAWEAIQGAYDLQVHVAPDVIARRIDDLDLAKEFLAHGLKGFVLKSHYFPTAERARSSPKPFRAFGRIGAIALNHSVGGLNPVAVELAGRSGMQDRLDADGGCGERNGGAARTGPISKLPFWAKIQLELAATGINPPPMTVIDDGRRTERLRRGPCLELIGKYDMILATGHLGRKRNSRAGEDGERDGAAQGDGDACRVSVAESDRRRSSRTRRAGRGDRALFHHHAHR